jgi:phosphatidylserine decarboxylase
MGRWETTLEQFRQALRIHGGVFPLCAAAMAVKLSRVPIPTKRLRLRVFRTIYGKKYAPLDETESERPLWTYHSLNALFTRGLRPESRPIPSCPDQFLAPCDGTVQDVGIVEDEKIVTVKGVEYTIASLLAGRDMGPFNGGHFVIIFLSPTECHRVFSPLDGQLESVTHVPGYRLLVHPPFQKKEFPPYSLNERVILRLRTPLGVCALILVAGWGVGNITLPIDRHYRGQRRHVNSKTYDPPKLLSRGDWIATFELGSTAILITEGGIACRPQVGPNEKVRYGQPLFALQGNAPSSENGNGSVG